jgi:hypothetical protein
MEPNPYESPRGIGGYAPPRDDWSYRFALFLLAVFGGLFALYAADLIVLKHVFRLL